MVSCRPERDGDLQLGADAIGRGDQHRDTGTAPVSSWNRLPKPPIPPSTAGVAVEAAACPISSTARRASSMSTPASRYAAAHAGQPRSSTNLSTSIGTSIG